MQYVYTRTEVQVAVIFPVHARAYGLASVQTQTTLPKFEYTASVIHLVKLLYTYTLYIRRAEGFVLESAGGAGPADKR